MSVTRWNQAHIFTLKEAPTEADIESQRLLVRGGYVRKLAPGIYTYGHLMLRSLRKFESIIRDELDKRGCTEILMPMVQPQTLWEETDRWTAMGAGLLKFKNRNEQGFCLGATHEEAVTDYVRQDLRSYRDLPRTLYQIQTKYRDEIRPRFGLLRCREFSMKDAYSFDRTQGEALASYQKMYEAYRAIFDRLGLVYRIVEADAGAIGGSRTHEFQLLAEAGEDALLVSNSTDFAANVEVCPAIDSEEPPVQVGELPIEKFPTPGLKTIEDLAKSLNKNKQELAKTLFYCPAGLNAEESIRKSVCVLVRGSDEVNEIKLKNALAWTSDAVLLSDAEVVKVSGAKPGSCGPVGLKIPVIMDLGMKTLRNLTVGANEDGFHLRNVNAPRDFQVTHLLDVRKAKAGDRDPTDPNGRLVSYRGIEVGHVFYLGTKYSKTMNLSFLDEAGKSQLVEMGCYGIGVSRTLQAALEQSHDADGIIWPTSVAPYHVHICLLDPSSPEAKNICEGLAKALHETGLDVLVDDRDERPGVKFKDADLLGMPVRLVIGQKGLAQNVIEVVRRKTKSVDKVSPDSVVERVKTLIGMQ